MLLSLAKDCEVEVSSEDEGFQGAWYGAILLDNPTNSGRKKLQVRYTTLIDEDRSSLLTELVDQRFIRPVPPKDPNGEADFEEGSVVDADLKDGWWTGVVIKKLEDQKFLVYFDYPPDLIQFERTQLRTHLDWIHSKWVQPEKLELSKSSFSSGTLVEFSYKIDKAEAVWVPALIVKEIEEDGEQKFIVKCCNMPFSFSDVEEKPNITVDTCNVRPLPPPIFVDEYKLLDRVEAFWDSGWRQCLVRGIHSDKRYTVSLVATNEESVFKHSDLRPSQEWEDGVWHQEPKKRNGTSNGKRKMSLPLETTLSERNAVCRPKKLKIIRSCTASKPITPASLSAGDNVAITPRRSRTHTKKTPKSVENIEAAFEGETEPHETVATMELPLAQESGNQIADDVMNGDAMPVITPQVIPIAKESPLPVTLVINVPLVKETEPETQGKTSPEKTLQPMGNQNGFGVYSTAEKMFEEHSSRENTHKKKREQKQDSNLKETGVDCNGSEALITDTSDNTCDDDYDQLLSTWLLGSKSSTGFDKSKLSPVRTPKNSAATMVLPFVKQSPFWKAFDSMEVFKTIKQSPHFSPLLETREEFREGLAVGEMVIFSSLIERVKKLQVHSPTSTLEALKDCFNNLEKFGFDVAAPISRIDMLLSLKDKQVNRMEELKDAEKKMTEEVIKKEKVEEDLKVVEGKILELRRQEADLKEKHEALVNDIAEMQLRSGDLDKKIQDVELEFQMTVEAPW